jgi:hypothetical protein
MPLVRCPGCGEDEALVGTRVDEGLELTCERCGVRWNRDTVPRCVVCGSDDVEGIPTSTLQEAGRGDQWAPSGVRLVYYCWACRANDVTSSQPQRGPQPAPGSGRNPRRLRRP